MTPDPLSAKYYGVSPYAFCNNDPVNFVDLDGVFVHRNNIGEFTGTFYHNKKQRIAGISEGCLIVSQKDWKAFSSQLSTVNNYHLIISRK